MVDRSRADRLPYPRPSAAQRLQIIGCLRATRGYKDSGDYGETEVIRRIATGDDGDVNEAHGWDEPVG